MTVAISTLLLDRLCVLAAAAATHEVCGLLFGNAHAVEAIEPVANVADDPATRFELDPAALFAAIRAERDGGRHIIGWYHSHPTGDPTPSACDARMADPDGKLWLIVAGPNVRAWRAVADGALHGRFDSVMLAPDESLGLGDASVSQRHSI